MSDTETGRFGCIGRLGMALAFIIIVGGSLRVLLPYADAPGTTPISRPTDPKEFCQSVLSDKIKATPGAFLVIATDPKSTGDNDGSVEVSWLVMVNGHQVALTCYMKPDGQSWKMEKVTGGAVNILH